MWFTGFFLLATSTFCVAVGFVPNQLPSTIHKLGLKPPCSIHDSGESDETIISQQSSTTVKSGSSNISFNNGFDDIGYSTQSFSTKTKSTSIQIEDDDSDSLQDLVGDIGEDILLSSTNMSTSSLTQSMSDLDILSGRSLAEGNLQENILMDNSEIMSDIISSAVEDDLTLSTISDQVDTAMEDIVEEITETTDTMTLSEIEENLETSNLINNGPIFPIHNKPSYVGHPPAMGGILPPNMMKPKLPGTMMNSVTPSKSSMNLANFMPPLMPKPHQPHSSITSPSKMPPMKPQHHPTGYIPSVTDLNLLPKPQSSTPSLKNQYKSISHLPGYPTIPPYSMPTPPMKKPYTPYQLPLPSVPTYPTKKPHGSYPYSSPPLMPTSIPKYGNKPPLGGYPRTFRENPFLSPKMQKPQIPYLPTTASETLTDIEYLTESWPQMNGYKPELPWQNNNFTPGMNMPGMNGPGMNLPGLNGLPYMQKYPIDSITDFDETSKYYSDIRNYGSLNSPCMNNISPDFPHGYLDTLESTYRSKYPLGSQPKKYPFSPNTGLYPLGSPEYPYTTPGTSYQNLSTPFWPYFGAPQQPSYHKPRHTPTPDYPYSSSVMPNSPYSSIPPPKIPIPVNRAGNSPGEGYLPSLSQYPPSGITPGKYPKPWHQPTFPPKMIPSNYPKSLHPPKLPPSGMIPNNYPKSLYPPKMPASGIIPGNFPKPLHPPKIPTSGIIPGNYPKPPHPPKIPAPGIIPGNYPKPPHPPKIPASGIIPGIYPKPPHLPKIPASGIIPGNYPKPPHPPKIPASGMIPGDYPHSTYPPNGAYPLDISYLIDEQPELYSYFDAIFICSCPGSLIAAKELSDAGKRVLIASSGSYPPPESYSLYLRPQILTQPNYVKRGPINIPGAFKPKQFYYPSFLGGISEAASNIWDYGTEQKNQQWGNTSPAWKWQNIAQLYDSVELVPGEIDAEGIIPVNRSIPRTQTIEYISSALQDLGISDLGTEYSLRDQPGAMMLPLMAEEGPAGLQPVVLAEEVLEDMNNPENVFLCLNTEIENINVIGDRAMGVTIKSPSGQRYSIDAQDVIMSGHPGKIAQLLYKAGLGDEMVLDQLQIPTQQHLPAVGKQWKVNAMFTGSLFTFPQGTLKELGTSDIEAKKEFSQGQYGIQSGILLDQFKAFISIQDGFESNVVIHFYAFTECMGERLNALMEGLFQFDEETQMYVRDLLQSNDILFAMPQLMDTKSQGEIVINSQSDLNFPPTLDSGMYTNPHDMLVMLGALRFVESLGETPTFQSLGANYVQISVDACMGYRSFEAYNECLICNLSVPGLYSSGGAIMGTNSLNSVVNQNLQVHGMENLYIMNSAVIPNGTGAESVATDSLIGQYGANFILQKNNLYF